MWPSDVPAPLSVQLRKMLAKNATRVIDLFRQWDDDGNGTISKKEFRQVTASNHQYRQSSSVFVSRRQPPSVAVSTVSRRQQEGAPAGNNP